jgi:hypothetical protein
VAKVMSSMSSWFNQVRLTLSWLSWLSAPMLPTSTLMSQLSSPALDMIQCGSLSQMSVTAEGAYFSKGIQTVIKAEDPEYLDVVDYFVNLEGRLMLMRDNVARLSRAYMSLGALWGECPPVSTGTRG